MDDPLRALQEWYAKQCDGGWEHLYGIEITTLDNPGWGVKIDLRETELEDRVFVSITEPAEPTLFEHSGRWMRCVVDNGKWEGVGDETKLARILKIFLDWAASENEPSEA